MKMYKPYYYLLDLKDFFENGSKYIDVRAGCKRILKKNKFMFEIGLFFKFGQKPYINDNGICKKLYHKEIVLFSMDFLKGYYSCLKNMENKQNFEQALKNIKNSVL